MNESITRHNEQLNALILPAKKKGGGGGKRNKQLALQGGDERQVKRCEPGAERWAAAIPLGILLIPVE